MALKQVVFAALLAFVGCKKHEETSETRVEIAHEPGTPTHTDTPATDSKQTGPGFTVVASQAAVTSQGQLADDQPTDDVFTFKSGAETYEVRIHPVRSDQNGLQAASLVRDKLVFTADVKLNEDDIAEGGVRGFDLSYKRVDDDKHFFVRSKIVSDDKNVYHVRAVWTKQGQEDAANAFVDSFAISN